MSEQGLGEWSLCRPRHCVGRRADDGYMFIIIIEQL